MERVSYSNLVIVIITYNPSDNILNLLKVCSTISGQVIVVDNNSSEIEWYEACNEYQNVCLIVNKRNIGISGAINKSFNMIDHIEKKWLLTFDQDSLPPNNIIDAYNYVIERESKIGLIGLEFYQNLDKKFHNHKFEYKSTLDLITSGLLHNMEVFNIAGKYNESLFIDCVDFEYALRTNIHGYKTIQISNCYLTHEIGNPKEISFLGFKIQSMNHNAFRQYYIVRNHIWLAKAYFKKFPKYIIIKFYHLAIRLLKTALIDDDRKDKIKKIFYGFLDGIKHSME